MAFPSGARALLLVALASCGLALRAQEGPAPGPTDARGEAPVRLANRTVAVLRAPFLGVPVAERARRTEHRLAEALSQAGPGLVTVRAEPQGRVVQIDGSAALILIPEDADVFGGETLESATRSTVDALQLAIAETREARDARRMLVAVATAGAVTLVFTGGLWLVLALRQRLVVVFARLLQDRASSMRIPGAAVLQSVRLLTFSRWLVQLLAWLLVVLMAFAWLGFVLTSFPYTRAWGEQLEGFLLELARHLGAGTLSALPGLAVAVMIFLIARAVVAVARSFFDRVEDGRVRVGWLDADLASPTRRLFNLAAWLFAIVMAYPYLPGADTEAFKGVSVLVGLMITLGGSSIVAQAGSGLILMYSRTLRVGEYVRIGDHEGTVHAIGTFTTRIRTGLGEEVSVPNALVLGSVTRNYSRTVQGRGYIVDTKVTVGYDTPWRQVEAMLTEAARRTPGVLETPEPRAFQTALSDFYIEYLLVAQAVPSEPRPRAEVLNALHANVVDVFNEFGVQIMSPHYLGDPASAKTVAREHWHEPPARRPG